MSGSSTAKPRRWGRKLFYPIGWRSKKEVAEAFAKKERERGAKVRIVRGWNPSRGVWGYDVYERWGR